MAIFIHKNIKEEYAILMKRIELLLKYEQTIVKEKEELIILSEELLTKIKEIEKNLKELTGIEQRIYYEIVVNGLNVTKAIDKVAFEFDKDPSTLWKTYYPKIKDKLK